LEGAKLIEQKLLEENFEEVFSFFTTFHNIDVLYIFCIFQINFVPNKVIDTLPFEQIVVSNLYV
jgi:hypothetical protein